MHHFFVNPEQIYNKEVVITGPDVNHIKNVLRMKPGEQVEVNDGDGTRYLCELETVASDCVHLRVLDTREADTELSSRMYLFQGLPKGDKMEWIVQKAVELGVYEIVPVATKRAVVKLDEKKSAKKTARWRGIAESGAKQSGRSLIPEVANVMTFAEALAFAGNLDIVLIPYEKAEGMSKTRQVIGQIMPGQSVGVFIGPEGGFEEEEVRLAMEHGAVPITLGRRILRTETAGLAALSILMYHLECDSHNL